MKKELIRSEKISYSWQKPEFNSNWPRKLKKSCLKFLMNWSQVLKLPTKKPIKSCHIGKTKGVTWGGWKLNFQLEKRCLTQQRKTKKWHEKTLYLSWQVVSPIGKELFWTRTLNFVIETFVFFICSVWKNKSLLTLYHLHNLFSSACACTYIWVSA